MNILLTNDDGYDAAGLLTLREVASEFGELWIVAPTHPMSGISHQVTFERPLQLMQTGHQAYSLDGTPADCVRIALTQLGVPFDWVLSGINNGANLGSDIFVSGTVAAAREAVLRGIKSLALSQHRRKFKAEFEWARSAEMARVVLQDYLRPDFTMADRTLLNINFPDRFHLNDDDDIPGDLPATSCNRVICNLDRHPLPTDFTLDEEGRFFYCSKYNQRPRMPDHDLDVCFRGDVAITELTC